MRHLLLLLLLPSLLSAQFGISPNRLTIQDDAGDPISNVVALRLGSGVGYSSINSRTLEIFVSPGAGVQTPWVQDIDGAGYDLSNVGDLTISGSTTMALTSTFQGAIRLSRTEVSGASYTVSGNDYILGVTRTQTGSASIFLPPATSSPNRLLIIVDEGFNATVNNITIQCSSGDTFTDGTSTLILDVDGESAHVYSTGTSWFIL